MRYVGQNFELEVSAPAGLLGSGDLQAVIESFHSEHERLYGYAIRNHDVELLNFGLTATSSHKSFSMPTVGPGRPAQSIGQAMVYFVDSAEPKLTKIYDRQSFGEGTVVQGPAIIGQLDTTTLLIEGSTATIDRHGNMVVRL